MDAIRSQRGEPTLELFGEEMLEQAKTAFSAAITRAERRPRRAEAREGGGDCGAGDGPRPGQPPRRSRPPNRRTRNSAHNLLLAAVAIQMAMGNELDPRDVPNAIWCCINPNESFQETLRTTSSTSCPSTTTTPTSRPSAPAGWKENPDRPALYYGRTWTRRDPRRMPR